MLCIPVHLWGRARSIGDPCFRQSCTLLFVLNSHHTESLFWSRSVRSFRSFFRPHAFYTFVCLGFCFLLSIPLSYTSFPLRTLPLSPIYILGICERKKKKDNTFTFLATTTRHVNQPHPSVSFHPSSPVPSTINLRSVSQLRRPNKSSP